MLDAETRRSLARSCSHERLSAAFLHQDSILIEHTPLPGNEATPSVGLRLERFNLGNGVDRITKRDGTEESPVQDRQKRHGVDSRRLGDQTGGDRHAEQAMRDGPAEWSVLAGLVVDMQRIEVSGEPRENDDIGFGNRSAGAFPFIPDGKIIKCHDGPLLACHDAAFPRISLIRDQSDQDASRQ